MTISELIERLEALKAEHGDLPVFMDDSGSAWDPAPEVMTRICPNGPALICVL